MAKSKKGGWVSALDSSGATGGGHDVKDTQGSPSNGVPMSERPPDPQGFLGKTLKGHK